MLNANVKKIEENYTIKPIDKPSNWLYKSICKIWIMDCGYSRLYLFSSKLARSTSFWNNFYSFFVLSFDFKKYRIQQNRKYIKYELMKLLKKKRNIIGINDVKTEWIEERC